MKDCFKMMKVDHDIPPQVCRKVFGAMQNFVHNKVNIINPDNIDQCIETLKDLCPDDDEECDDLKEQMRAASRKGPRLRIKCLSGHFVGYKNKANNIKIEGWYKEHPEKILFESMPISYSSDEDKYEFQLDRTLLIPKKAEGSIVIHVKKLSTKNFSKKLSIGKVEIECQDNYITNKCMILDGGKPTGSFLNVTLEKEQQENSSVSEIFCNYLCNKAKLMFDLQEDKYIDDEQIAKKPLELEEYELLVVSAIITCLHQDYPNNWNGHFNKIQSGILDILADPMIIKKSTIAETISKAFIIAHSKQVINDEIISTHLPLLIPKMEKKFFLDYKKHALKIISTCSDDVNSSKLQAAIKSLKILVEGFPEWIEDVRECITNKIETSISLALYDEIGETTKVDNIPKITKLYDVCTRVLNVDANCDPEYNSIFRGLLPDYLPYSNFARNIYVKKCKELVIQDTMDHENSLSSMINKFSEDIIDTVENSFEIFDAQYTNIKIRRRLDSEAAESFSEDDLVVKLYQSNFNCFWAFKRIMTNYVEEDCFWLYERFEKFAYQWMDLGIKKAEYQLSRLLEQEKRSAASIVLHGSLTNEDKLNDSPHISQTLSIFRGITGQLEKFLMDLHWPNGSTYLRLSFAFIECYVWFQRNFIEKYCKIYTENMPLNYETLSAIINLVDGLKIQDQHVLKWQHFFEEITKITLTTESAENNMIIVKNCYQLMERANKHGRGQIEKSKNMYFTYQKKCIQKYILEGNIDSKDGNDCLLSYICDKELKNLVDNFKDDYQKELSQRLWDLMEGQIIFFHYSNVPKTYDEKLHLMNSIEGLIGLKSSMSDFLASTDLIKLKKLKSDMQLFQPYAYLGAPKVEKGSYCALICDKPQLHKITKIQHSENLDQTIANGDIVYIKTMETNFQQGYDIIYCSDWGNIYYDKRKPEENKQLWIVHKTQEHTGIAPIFSFESLKFPGRFLGFSHDGGIWPTCNESSGKIGWLMFVQSKDKSGVVTKLAIDPNDKDILKKTSEELIAICLAKKCEEQLLEKNINNNQVPKATLKITESNVNDITLDVKSISGLRPMTSKGDISYLKICIKMFPNGNLKFDQKSWMCKGPFKDAIAFDLVGEPVKHTFDISHRINKEFFFVISFFDATPFMNNIFDKAHRGINNPLGLNIFIGEFMIERGTITKHLQEWQETQTYQVAVFKDFYQTPAFKQLEYREEKIAKQFTNTENVMLKREPFVTDNENWSITIIKTKARSITVDEKLSEELILMCLANKWKEQQMKMAIQEKQLPKTSVKITAGIGSNNDKITVEIKSISHLRPMTSKSHVSKLKIWIKMFPNQNQMFDQISWMLTGPFKDAIDFDLLGESIRHTFDVGHIMHDKIISGELYFVISVFDATQCIKNPFDRSNKGINNPLGLNIFIGEFVVEKELINKHLQNGGEYQIYNIDVLKDFQHSPAFNLLENRDDKIAKKFTNTEHTLVKREPFMADNDNWSITVIRT